MDFGASSHVAGNSGNLDKLVSPSVHTSPFIVVGDGSHIPVAATGIARLTDRPFHLNNILYSPEIMTSLISVCRFTWDNSCIIAFDPFGFSVKDLATGTTLMWSSSSGDLYPFHPNKYGA